MNFLLFVMNEAKEMAKKLRLSEFEEGNRQIRELAAKGKEYFERWETLE